MKLILTAKNTYSGDSGFYARVSPVKNEAFTGLVKLLEASCPITFNEVYDDPHVTVMYSPKSPNALAASLIHDSHEHNEFLARSIRVLLWPGHNGKGYVVLKLLCPDLCLLHEKLKKTGAVPTFSPYAPHMTLCKDCGDFTQDIKNWQSRVNTLLGTSPILLTYSQFGLEPMR